MQVRDGKKLKVGMDMDGTLAYSHDVILDAYNAIKGSSFSKQDIRGCFSLIISQ